MATAPSHIPELDFAHFREHLSFDECKRLTHHGHCIPATRGYTAAYIADNLPGWTWNELVRVFVAAGLLVNRGGAPATCREGFTMFHFSSPTEFHVEWIDGVAPLAGPE